LASNRVKKAATVARAAAPAAPAAAGGLGLVLLGLGAIWAVSQVTGPIGDIVGGAKKVAQGPPDFLGGLFGEERVEEEIPLSGFEGLGRVDPDTGAAYWYGPDPRYDPDVPTSYTIEGGKVVVINPNPGLPMGVFYEFDVPSAARRAGTALRANIGEALDPSEYGSIFEGQIPFGGPKFDIRPWKW